MAMNKMHVLGAVGVESMLLSLLNDSNSHQQYRLATSKYASKFFEYSEYTEYYRLFDQPACNQYGILIALMGRRLLRQWHA